MAAEGLHAQLERVVAELGVAGQVDIQLERPRNPEHGDLATNLAMVLAGRLRRPPRQVADELVARLDPAAAGLASAEVAGPGFINFRLSADALHDQLTEILAADGTYGRLDLGRGRPVLVEFVSANPTGPLHVAHGRGAAIGDVIANLLAWTGHDVSREFYVNDTGVQIQKLAESLEARWLQLQGVAADIPAGGYHGEYLVAMAAEIERAEGAELRRLDGRERLDRIGEWAATRLRAEQDRDLRTFGVVFDEYYAESRVYAGRLIDETLAELAERGLTYEAEGALWLRTGEFGDDKDRVLVKRDGSYTYFLPDIAYHRDKARRGFDHAIDVWGADHHGYVPRMQAALETLGLDGFLDIEIVQMVRLMRGGEEVKLSKRAGEIVALRDLVAETGADVARYFFLMRRSGAQMLFDLDLALDQSEKNPVYKVQYAHARMMSIFRKAGVAAEEITADGVELARLAHPREQELIKQLGLLPGTVEQAAESRAPHVICDFLEATAGMVNSWYHAGNPSRNPELAVLADEPAVRRARLVLARAVQIVLRNGLGLLGLTAPERMQREDRP